MHFVMWQLETWVSLYTVDGVLDIFNYAHLRSNYTGKMLRMLWSLYSKREWKRPVAPPRYPVAISTNATPTDCLLRNDIITLLSLDIIYR
jgi:hypothetical protein